MKSTWGCLLYIVGRSKREVFNSLPKKGFCNGLMVGKSSNYLRQEKKFYWRLWFKQQFLLMRCHSSVSRIMSCCIFNKWWLDFGEGTRRIEELFIGLVGTSQQMRARFLENSLLFQVLKSNKYFPDQDFLEEDLHSRHSFNWRGLVEGKKALLKLGM